MKQHADHMMTIATGSKVQLNESMSRHTTYGIGGNADIYFVPASRDDLIAVIQYARENNIPLTLMGSGSNCLVSDKGIRGLVISMAGGMKGLAINGNNVQADSGVMLGHLVLECTKAGLTGTESLIGVPGTLGGALVMNAGAYGREISNHLISVDVISSDGQLKLYSKADLSFAYRQSSFATDEIIVSAKFDFPYGDATQMTEARNRASSSRKASQPLKARSAGSVFKNPSPTVAAGKLIDEAGLKRVCRGGAEISAKHANFIINRGDATAADVAYLIKLATRAVNQQFDTQLQLEIRTLGFEDRFWADVGLRELAP